MTLLTLAEAVALSRLSTRTFNRRLADGSGPAVVRIGRRAFIRQSDFDTWIDRCATQPR